MIFFDVHTHKKASLENVFSIENNYSDVLDFTTPFSIEIHPWFIHEDKIKEALFSVEEKLQEENCVALGACGLDKFTTTDFELQQFVFKKQIGLSENYQKPLIIHCVKAFQEIIKNKDGFLHGFYQNVQIAESLLKNGLMLSMGAAIINNKKLQEVVLEIPLAFILLEKDNAAVEVQAIYQKDGSS